MSYFVGLDWASREHTVCVIDAQARVIWRATIPHTAEGLTALRTKLVKLAASGTLPVAVERPSGLVVDTLVDAGFPVVPIHPNVLKASRPRYSAAQRKSDPGDAFILADLLRTDGHRFRALQPLSDELRALRTLVRTRDDLVTQRIALANQLRALLEGFWPGAAAMFADVDSPIALAFLQQYPTPRSAQHLGEKRLQAFLARHAYCGRRAAHALLERLHRAPTGLIGDAAMEANEEVVRALVMVLTPLVAQIQQLTAAIEHAIAAHPDGPVFTSFPRAGQLNAAQIFAEIGDDRRRFTSAEHLAAEAGMVPVTYASGKHRGVAFRWACNKPSAERSAPSRITPVMRRPGRPPCTRGPEPEAVVIRTPCGSSPEHGSGSSGAAGRTKCRITRLPTVRSSGWRRLRDWGGVDTGCLRGPEAACPAVVQAGRAQPIVAGRTRALR